MDGRISKMDNQAQAMSTSTKMEGALNTLHNQISGAESMLSDLERRLVTVAEPQALAIGTDNQKTPAPESSMVIDRIDRAEQRVGQLYGRIESLLGRLHT